MPPRDRATKAARSQFYLTRATNGKVLDKTFSFFPGKPTIPNSFTGNQILGASSGGVSSDFLDGIRPPLQTPETCDAPLIGSLVLTDLGANIQIIVEYSNPSIETDIYQLFASNTGASLSPTSVTQGPAPTQVTLLFPDVALFAPGFYSLRISRATSPTTCLDVRRGLLYVEGPQCTLELFDLQGDGVEGFSLPITDGTTDNTVQLTGAGFLDGPLEIEILGGDTPQTLNITNTNIIDDENIELTFDAVGSEAPDPAIGEYVVIILRADLAECGFQLGTIVIDAAPPACTLTFTLLRGDGVQGNRPPVAHGSTGNELQITGTGFLDGVIDVEISGGDIPQTLNVTNINILTDTNMTVTFDAVGSAFPSSAEGDYIVTITRTDIADCSSSQGTVVVDPDGGGA